MYSKNVIDHTSNPRNVGTLDANDPNVGTGLVGSPACGDVMRLQIKVSEDGVIEAARFKTFGCGSAIASSSLATEWIQGRNLEQAEQIKNSAIAEELNLPPVKLHCSVLAEDAIRMAIEDYRRKQAAKSQASAAGRAGVGEASAAAGAGNGGSSAVAGSSAAVAGSGGVTASEPK